jgi:hypothetical protein
MAAPLAARSLAIARPRPPLPPASQEIKSHFLFNNFASNFLVWFVCWNPRFEPHGASTHHAVPVNDWKLGSLYHPVEYAGFEEGFYGIDQRDTFRVVHLAEWWLYLASS